MSVYDFNHQEQANTNHVSHGPCNGSLTRYQVEGEYIGRGFPSTHHLDMSVQLTRPTSKTAMLVRQRRAMLEQLSCGLCMGYLIDATTIDECMDSFCKSCIVVHLRNHNNCPKCGTLIHKTNPLSAIRSDKVLQDIVYKLIPGLYDNEMKRRREFYRNLYGLSSEEDEDGSVSSFTGRSPNLTGEQHGVVPHPKPFYKLTDNIDLSIEPQTRNDSFTIFYDNKRQSIVTCFTGNLHQQQQPPIGSAFTTVDSQKFKTYLRCPAKLTTLQLKKFIAAKFNICRYDTIHLLYLNESLKDEYSLIDIAYIYDWRGIEHMRLYYIIERDLNKSDGLDVHQPEEQPRKTKAPQTVGTSTQTVKRVCIDPKPRFYDELASNSSQSNLSGRQTRFRTDTSSSNINKAASPTTQSSQAHTLRSNSSGRATGFESGNLEPSTTNGVMSRELVALGGCHGVVHTTPKSTVADAVDELSRLTQDNPRDKRILRRPATESSESIPKININLSSLNRPQNVIDKTINTYSRVKSDAELHHQEFTNNNKSVRQLVPYMGQGYSIATGMAGPSHNSMVSLASFSGARQVNNQVVAMSGSSTTSTSCNRNNVDFGSPPKLDLKSDAAKNNQVNKSSSVVPQLAFSFVTERGITIVRRMNSQEEASASNNTPADNTKTNNVSALPNPVSQRAASSNGLIRPNPSQYPISTNQICSGGSSGVATSSNQTGQESTSSRHHIKVKPVYKTFVDPTKLKSPNFKKLGFTARH